MRPTVSQYARSLAELAVEAGSAEVAVLAKNFSGFLKRRGEEKKLPAILKQLQNIEAEKEGRIEVTAVLAHEADEMTKKRLSLQAEKLFPKKKVALFYRIDKEVIGGVVFRTDEVLYDATLSAGLKSLKTVLIK